jgi:hypothetical protein
MKWSEWREMEKVRGRVGGVLGGFIKTNEEGKGCHYNLFGIR